MDCFEDQRFENRDFTNEILPKAEYVASSFIGCMMMKMDLSGYVFEDCTFSGCELSMIISKETAWRNVTFRACKMLGVDFGPCKNFGLSFTFLDCLMDHSSFFSKKLRHTRFSGCRLLETDFGEADLTSAVFDHCDLTRTVFIQSNLENCDMRTSRGYSFDPAKNRLRGAMFSYPDVLRLLDKYGIRIE